MYPLEFEIGNKDIFIGKLEGLIKMKKLQVMIFTVSFILAGICLPQAVQARQPSTQAELEKATAALQKAEQDVRNAYDYLDLCKANLDAAIASGDSIAISAADFEHKRAGYMVDWTGDMYFNALAYLDHVKSNMIEEDIKEKYTNTVYARGAFDLARAAYTEAQNQLNASNNKLAELQVNINNMNAALPTHPELQAPLNESIALIPVIQAEISQKTVALEAAKAEYENKKDALEALGNVYLTHGEHKVTTHFFPPYYPVEKIW